MTAETNAERLVRIKNLPSHAPLTITSVQIYKIDLDWLIEQTERVSELEIENARLREALEFYADADNNHHKIDFTIREYEYLSAIVRDEGEKARQALKGESEE